MTEMKKEAQYSKEQITVEKAEVKAEEQQKVKTAVADEKEDWVKKYKEQFGTEPSFF